MVNDELKQKMKEKIDAGDFGPGDLPEYFQLMGEVCNESDDIKDEIEGWNRKFQFHLEGIEDEWLTVEDGKFTFGAGKMDGEPDITLEMQARTAAGIFTGEIDATSAYMAGDLKVNGPLPDAVKFRTIVELIREELD
jgi:putative sterol carrier protein